MEYQFRAWDEKQQYMAFQGDNDLETVASFMHHFGERQLMLSSGLFDKNGLEIYDGDIVRIFDNGQYFTARVVFSGGSFWVEGLHLIRNQNLFHSDVSCREVLGNVFENPELLPKSAESV